jgi:hypothetical protein
MLAFFAVSQVGQIVIVVVGVVATYCETREGKGMLYNPFHRVQCFGE